MIIALEEAKYELQNFRKNIADLGDALRIAQDRSDEKNFYGWNPAFDKNSQYNRNH